MIPYLAVFRVRFTALLQYRAAAAAGFLTQVFWGFVRIMIIAAFYRSATGPHPMTLAEVVTYIWLGQAMLMILPFRPEPEAEELVRTGNVVFELLRPVDLHHLWFARSVSFRTAPVLLRSVPLLVLAFLFFGLDLPASPFAGVIWAFSLLMAVLLSSALTTLISVTMLWTISGRGVAALMAVAAWVFSGITLPLPLFPDWFQPVLTALPFRGLMDTPFRIYLGHLPPGLVLPALAHQVAWTAALILLGRWMLSRAIRRLVVQGG